MRAKAIDRWFLLSVVLLMTAGFFIFSSAALSLLAQEKASWSSIAFNQTFFGLFLGTLAMLWLSRVHYRFWRRYAFYIFLLALASTLLVFIPQLGLEHAGARRWLNLLGLSFQPVEFLKIGFVIYLAAWLSGVRISIKKWRFGLIPLFVLLFLVGAVLFKQPDMDAFVVIASAGLAMFAVAGASWRDLFIIFLIGIIGAVFIIQQKPYIKERIEVFWRADSPQGAGYQARQSLIAIGSGGLFGRGFGQSVQKFSFLPEPIGDSVFAVAAEEFGFAGSLFLILLFLFFALQGIKIAHRSPDLFGGLLVIGIITLVISQSFLNMAAMLGVLPMSGLPLIFVSHGGSALFLTLAAVGIILNVSRYQIRG